MNEPVLNSQALSALRSATYLEPDKLEYHSNGDAIYKQKVAAYLASVSIVFLFEQIVFNHLVDNLPLTIFICILLVITLYFSISSLVFIYTKKDFLFYEKIQKILKSIYLMLYKEKNITTFKNTLSPQIHGVSFSKKALFFKIEKIYKIEKISEYYYFYFSPQLSAVIMHENEANGYTELKAVIEHYQKRPRLYYEYEATEEVSTEEIEGFIQQNMTRKNKMLYVIYTCFAKFQLIPVIFAIFVLLRLF